MGFPYCSTRLNTLSPSKVTSNVCVPVEHVNKRGWLGMWSQPARIENIQLCVCACVCRCVCGVKGYGYNPKAKETNE